MVIRYPAYNQLDAAARFRRYREEMAKAIEREKLPYNYGGYVPGPGFEYDRGLEQGKRLERLANEWDTQHLEALAMNAEFDRDEARASCLVLGEVLKLRTSQRDEARAERRDLATEVITQRTDLKVARAAVQILKADLGRLERRETYAPLGLKLVGRKVTFEYRGTNGDTCKLSGMVRTITAHANGDFEIEAAPYLQVRHSPWLS